MDSTRGALGGGAVGATVPCPRVAQTFEPGEDWRWCFFDEVSV
jgi:hypothetical protein